MQSIEEALLMAALVLAAIHFGVPLTYYWYAKNKWLSKPWNIKADESYKPRVTIIVPTYNEAEHIEDKLHNIYEQSYPKELIEVLVVDGASSDGTPELVERWAMKYPDLNVTLVREKERRGKATALNEALKLATGEVIVIADADAEWESNALPNAIKYLADPKVGAVSCIKYPQKSGPAGVEKGYRSYYNLLRIAESKAYSTPLFHGELAAFKRELLKKVGGFPTDVGADDSLTATEIAVMGFRAIVAEDVVVLEKIPDSGYGMWRIRRAQHLIQHFIRTLKYVYVSAPLKTMILIEAYLHLFNPWLLVAAFLALLTLSLVNFTIVIPFLALGVVLLMLESYRTWITTQLYLIFATLRNLFTKEIIWAKQKK